MYLVILLYSPYQILLFPEVEEFRTRENNLNHISSKFSP